MSTIFGAFQHPALFVNFSWARTGASARLDVRIIRENTKLYLAFEQLDLMIFPFETVSQLKSRFVTKIE
jgi:hypothetical protein